jgi:DNA-binding LytR/AlgR family response regulator
VSGYQTAPEAAAVDGLSAAPQFHLEEPGKTSGAGTRPTMIPVETEGATRLLPAASICAVQATTHYTLVYDGQREYFSPWSISEAEQRLAGHAFMRVHRSHLVALDKVNSLRRAGDGAAVEVGQPTPRVVPVSRGHYAELKARLGLRNRMRGHIATR